jgi:hypothetical protein
VIFDHRSELTKIVDLAIKHENEAVFLERLIGTFGKVDDRQASMTKLHVLPEERLLEYSFRVGAAVRKSIDKRSEGHAEIGNSNDANNAAHSVWSSVVPTQIHSQLKTPGVPALSRA